ncbi:hypothetical protein LMC46_15590 [Escherichia coli]|nr:hypothetical protein [Escherichia coli]
MSMTNILTIAVSICQGKRVRVPAMTKRELADLLDAVAVLRQELRA